MPLSQAAYMVPTELLAIQHKKHLLDLLQNVDPDRRPSVALLTGSTPTKEARMIRNVHLETLFLLNIICETCCCPH